MKKDARIYVAGHRGLVGSAIVRRLAQEGYAAPIVRTHAELDLTRQADVEAFFQGERPEAVFLAAAKVGGIWANHTLPADFMLENLLIQTNVIRAAFQTGVKRLLFLGSSCIYPRDCPQPIREEYLLTSALEKTNEAYALAKIAGLKTCEYLNRQHGTRYLSVMPCNLYGPGDNFHPEHSHVLPALLRKCHEAKREGAAFIEVWGTGKPLREFLYADDLAEACVQLMAGTPKHDLYNIGSGDEISILDLARLIAQVVGFEGEIRLNPDKPDGTPRKVTDLTRIHATGWKARTGLAEGLRRTYEWYVAQA